MTIPHAQQKTAAIVVDVTTESVCSVVAVVAEIVTVRGWLDVVT